jgi:ApaG protein
MSEAVTNGIRVEVMSRHSTENSRPQQGEWVFEYTVRITNQGLETVQLISRHWIITDGLEHTEEVRGPGVVGEQPVLAPGESFKYSSWCPLKTPSGTMRGTYRMVGTGGKQFEIEIAPFGLRAKYTVH